MMRSIFSLAAIALLAVGLQSCGSATGSETAVVTTGGMKDKAFNDYWYSGTAELSSYTVQQARYGEMHDGEAVLVFVTEPFSASKLVKLDYPDANPSDRVDVLKLNFTKKFFTGIYPYSMMTSVFTPVDYAQHPNTMKVSTSSLEWCGHSFTQMEMVDDGGYNVTQHSYFESEGEATWKLKGAVVEDGIWNQIRMNPQALPTGDIKAIPGSFSSRLRHVPLAVEKATATLADHPTDGKLQRYSLNYTGTDRQLVIDFQKDFPHEIEGWEETYVSGFGAGAKKLTTKAKRKTTIKTDYWNKHNVEDAEWRKKLMLDGAP